MNKLIQELRRRNVFKAAISYVVISWALLQAAGLILPLFGFSTAAVRIIFFILLGSFPLWMAFAYIFEWTPEGFKKTVNVPSEVSVSKKTDVKLNSLITGGLVVAVVFLLVDRFVDFSGAKVGQSPVEKSVAVLPFDNMSGDEDAYFAAGVTEDILTQLSKIGDLRVLSHFTLRDYDYKGKTVEQIGQELGVDYLLTGNIRRAGEELRITCRLVQTNPEEQTWADNYDRRMDDIFAIQSQVAEEVANKLRANLTEAENEKLDQKPTESIAAYNIYLKGRDAYQEYTPEGFAEAIKLFKQALVLDTSFGLAYAGLADAWAQSYAYGILPEDYLDSAQAAAEKTITLAPEAAESWNTAGLVEQYKGNSDAAEEYWRKALEVNPNHATAVNNLASTKSLKGELDQAIGLYKKCIALNPLNFFYYTNLGYHYSQLGLYERASKTLKRASGINGEHIKVIFESLAHYTLANEKEEALTWLDRYLALGKENPRVYPFASEAALYLGEDSLARECLSKAMVNEAFEPYEYYGPAVLGYLLWQEGKVDSAKAWLDPQLETLEQKLAKGKENQEYLYQIFINQAIRGNKQEALDYLERLLDAGDGRSVNEYIMDPRLSYLLKEPRFQQLMDRIQRRMDRQRMEVLAREEDLNL